ncbi:MAG: hypothetical protein DBX59_08670 [Bacillota bacterium]|nr:MAG: hypothetical protein DBX59_08670 [Bacillota bacterium]
MLFSCFFIFKLKILLLFFAIFFLLPFTKNALRYIIEMIYMIYGSILMLEEINYVKTSNRYTSRVFWETPKHKHSFWEAVIVVMGESTHEASGKSFTLCEGDMLIMKPGDSHVYKIKDAHNYLHFDLYLSSQAIRNANNYFAYDFLSMLESSAPIKLRFSDCEWHSIYEQLKQLLLVQGSPETQMAETIYRWLLSSVLAKFYENVHAKEQKTPEWYKKLVLAMNDPAVLQGTIEDLARIVNFSHGYLCKIFKAYTGERLIDYFTKVKLEHSKNLMYNKKLNLLQISSMIGYDSLSHYIRVFKKFNSTTPQAYRKKIVK